jgi:hypothetical protein
MRIVRMIKIVLPILLLLYCGSYVVFSAGGCYEPATVGLDHVNAYGWAPRGFVAGYRWKRWPLIVFAPLYVLDINYWHTFPKVNSGEYPVDWVKPEDVWKLYRAWGFLDKEEPPATEKTRPQR